MCSSFESISLIDDPGLRSRESCLYGPQRHNVLQRELELEGPVNSVDSNIDGAMKARHRPDRLHASWSSGFIRPATLGTLEALHPAIGPCMDCGPQSHRPISALTTGLQLSNWRQMFHYGRLGA